MKSTIVRYGFMALVVAMSVSLVAAAPVLATTTAGTFGDDSTEGADDDTDGTDGSLLTESTNSSDDSTGTSGGSDDSSDDGSTADDSTDGSDGSTSGESSDGADGSADAGDDADDEPARPLTERLSEPADSTLEATAEVRTGSLRSVDGLVLAGFGDQDVGDDTSDEIDDAADTVRSTADGAVSALEGETDTVIRSLTGETDGVQETTAVEAPPPRAGAARMIEADRSVAAPSANVPDHGGSEGVPPGPTSGLAVGLGAVAVGAAARKGALAPGIVGNLGGVLSTAGLAPVLGRSSLLDRLVRAVAPLRYSRYDDSDPLEHEARSTVFEIVESTPGAYLSEVADRADLPLSTARHHVRILEREDLVSGAKVRGKRRFYPAYTNGLELAAAMNDDATASVLDAIARLGAASVSDLANDLGRDPSTISHHLQRLEEDGIIVRERDGRAVMNRLSPDARTALVPEAGEAEVAEAGEVLASD